MPGPYTFRLYDDTNSFNYNGENYEPGNTYSNLDACEMKDLLSAFSAANPNRSTNDDDSSIRVLAELEQKCPATPNDAKPQPAPTTSPAENNPAKTGGDSATLQAAPTPPVSATVGKQSSNDTGADPSPDPSEEPKRPPDGESNKTHSDEQPQVQTNAGDPVDIFTGAFYFQETDLEIPNTILPLSFTRIYRSGAAAYGPLGWNWDHNYNLYLRELNDGNIALWRSLHEDIYKFDGVNFEPPRGIFEKLIPVTGLAQVYEITGDGGTVMRFERPAGWIDGERIPLVSIQDRHGNMLKFTYDAEDKLAEVRDDDDRFLRFEYDSCELLVAVSDSSGRKYSYHHDEQTSHLVCITSPSTTDLPDGITKIYYYEQPFALPELRHNIIRVEDSHGNIYVENKYEQDPGAWSYARVTEQLYGSFLYQFQYTQLQWVPENSIYINIPSVRVEVMNPDFGLETYTFNYRGDLLDLRFRLNKDNSFRVVAIQYEFDEQGNLSVTTKPDGSQEKNTYDFSNPDPCMRGKLLQRELIAAAGFPAPSRIVWRGKYETVYQLLTEEKNEVNSVIKYKYDFDLTPAAPDNSGKLKQIIYPDATLPDGAIQTSSTKFEHNSKGQVTANVLPNGIRQETVYGTVGDEKSRAIEQIFDVGGLNITNEIEYSSIGFDVKKIDGNGNSSQTIVNALGLVEKMILPEVNGDSAEYVMHYSTDKKIISSERPKGEFTDPLLIENYLVDIFDRDVLGYPVKYHLSDNTGEKRSISVCNDFRGFPVKTINPDGSSTIAIYDERGLLISETIKGADGTQLSKKRVYDRSGNLSQETDYNKSTTKFAYDGFTRISKVTLPNATEINYKWLKGDLLESLEYYGDDGFGNIRLLSKTMYTYDEKYRKVTETVQSFTDNPARAIDITTTYFYDTLDRIEKIVNNRGGINLFQYDGVGRLIAEIDAIGNEDRYIYDNNVNIIETRSQQQEPDGTVSVLTKFFRYDERNRRIETIESDGARMLVEYDDRDLIVRQTDYLGLIKETKYNSFGNFISEVYDPGGLAIAHQWILDRMSRATAYIDPVGQVSNYFFDGIGRNTKTIYANGFTSTKTFNSLGQISTETLGSGVTFEYGYDPANRLTSITNTAFPASVNQLQQHDYTYDGLDRLISAKTGTNEVIRKYDSLSRLISETTLGSTIKCGHQDNTGIVDKIFPDGRTERHTYNLNGTLTSIRETVNGNLGSGGTSIANFITSGADAFGEATYQGNLKIQNKYDERKRLVETSVKSPIGTDEIIKYRYDRGNRKRIETIGGQNPTNNYFEYDNKYRLAISKDSFTTVVPDALTQDEHDLAINAVKASAATATRVEQFVYNPADARTQYMETGNPDRNYTYLTGHRVQNDGINNYTHFTDGTLQSDGVFTYTTDALGRIVEIKSGGNVIFSIEYDAFNRPSIINESGKPSRSFNYLGAFVEQENENGIPTRQKTLHPATGVPVAYHVNNQTHYTIFDARYNLIGITDTNGDLLETYRYQSFGIPNIYDATGANIALSQHGIEPIFGGQRYLSSTGLYLSNRRLMNPVHGLFLSPDPKGYANSASLYAYSAQNPIDLADPDGELAFLAVLAVMAIGAVVAGGLNAIRQGIQIAEGARNPDGSLKTFSWGELGESMGWGGVLAPILVFAPELAIPFAAKGVYGGIEQYSQGNYATGTFDIATSLIPFGFKGVRNTTLGRGSVIGQARGLGPLYSPRVRLGRFELIQNNFKNFIPSPFGRRIGLGFAGFKARPPHGHSAVVVEGAEGQFSFFEKLAGGERGARVAKFNVLENIPESDLPNFYADDSFNFNYEFIKVSKNASQRASGYAQSRTSTQHLIEPFDKNCANCSHFAADVLGEAGFKGLGNGRASGLFNDFTNFNIATNMSYAAPFWARLPMNISPYKK
jgi:RHS repeat-associated protein